MPYITAPNIQINKQNIYPSKQNTFKALELTPLEHVKVVILGQDPYHGEGQANGLAFSVNKNIKIPPSLRNIYKELETDLNIKTPNHGDLTHWATQGVLLLNSVLTVEPGRPGSHANIGWEQYTDQIIKQISTEKEHIVFILWGKYAENKRSLIDENKHLIIVSPHPSPFSARKGFFGSRPFSRTNAYLIEKGMEPVDWKIL